MCSLKTKRKEYLLLLLLQKRETDEKEGFKEKARTFGYRIAREN